MAPVGEASAGSEKPGYVRGLEASFGAPSQAAFGSAVFFERLDSGGDLEASARTIYRTFVGDLWARYGEAAWMGPWKEVYSRGSGAGRDIVSELRSISDREAKQSVPMLVDGVEDADHAKLVLSAAFDDPAVSELSVFNVGDGEAMSGLLIAGHRAAAGEATFLVFLMD